jgi:hypothetical protein
VNHKSRTGRDSPAFCGPSDADLSSNFLPKRLDSYVVL